MTLPGRRRVVIGRLRHARAPTSILRGEERRGDTDGAAWPGGAHAASTHGSAPMEWLAPDDKTDDKTRRLPVHGQ